MLFAAIGAITGLLSLAIQIGGLALKVTAVKEVVSITSIDNVNSIRGFDNPFQNIFSQIVSLIDNSMDFAQSLIFICCFLFIVLNSIKIMFGAQELKKFFVDAILKCLIVVVLMSVYPTIVTKTYTIASKLGLEISNGEEVLETAFLNITKKTRDIWIKGSQKYFDALKYGKVRNNQGLYEVDDSYIDFFTESGMTEEEAREWAMSNQIKFVEKQVGYERDQEYEVEYNQLNKIVNNESGKTDPEKQKQFYEQQQQMKRAYAIISGLTQLVTNYKVTDFVDGEAVYEANTNVSTYDIMKAGENSLSTIFYNPFIEGTSIISTNSMLKTAVVICEMISSGLLAPFSEVDENGKTENGLAVYTSSTTNFISWLGILLKNFIFKCGMIIFVILIMIEYTLTLIEFFYVMVISAILIPLYFIDATKSFVTNMIRTVLSYFIKIVVTISLIFFVMSMYINSMINVITNDMSAILWVVYYIYVLMFGLILAKSGGKIAGAVISGQPSMGIGDFTQQMHGMMHAARSGMGMTKQTLQQAKQGVQTVGTGVANAGVTLDGMRNARMAAMNEATSWNSQQTSDASKIDVKQAGRSAAWSYFGQSAKQQGQDRAYTAFTGQKAERENIGNISFGKIGQTYTDEKGDQKTVTAGMAKEKNKQAAESIGNDVVAKMTKPRKDSALTTKEEEMRRNSMPPDDQDSILNK